MISNAWLCDVLEDYAVFRSLAKRSRAEMQRPVALFARWLGRRPTLADLSDRTVSQWLAEMQLHYAQRTVANHRTALLCLWRFASDLYGIDPPHRVRRVSRPDPCPIAWTMDELKRLLTATNTLRGTFRRTGANRATYCTALVLFCYESGLRRSDVWRIHRNQVREDGTIILRQHKTGRTHTPRIRKRTVSLLEQLPGAKPLACPYASTSDWYKFWRTEVVKPAKLRNGAIQQLRRTGATHLAIDHPEAVQRYLGHRTASMQRHYVDQSIATPQQHLPPDPNTREAASWACDAPERLLADAEGLRGFSCVQQ